MIAVKADKDHVEVSIPTEGMTPEEVNALVSWLRVETIVRKSKSREDALWQLSEEIKADWWAKNEGRFTPEDAQ